MMDRTDVTTRAVEIIYLIIVLIAVSIVVSISHAWGGVTVSQIEQAFNLHHGSKFQTNITGQPLEVTYLGIEPRHGKQFAIIVEVQ